VAVIGRFGQGLMTWLNAISGIRAADADALRAACELPMDSEAFAGFYERSARGVWAYLARVSGDPALADDLMQESFVRFLVAGAPEEGEVACRKYLFRIATNLLRDHWRGAKTSSMEGMAEELFVAVDASGGAEARVMLGPAMARLKPREREILWLAHAEGYSHREVAEIVGVGSASLRLMLFRARRKMAEMLKDGGRHEA